MSANNIQGDILAKIILLGRVHTFMSVSWSKSSQRWYIAATSHLVWFTKRKKEKSCDRKCRSVIGHTLQMDRQQILCNLYCTSWSTVRLFSCWCWSLTAHQQTLPVYTCERPVSLWVINDVLIYAYRERHSAVRRVNQKKRQALMRAEH